MGYINMSMVLPVVKQRGALYLVIIDGEVLTMITHDTPTWWGEWVEQLITQDMSLTQHPPAAAVCLKQLFVEKMKYFTVHF